MRHEEKPDSWSIENEKYFEPNNAGGLLFRPFISLSGWFIGKAPAGQVREDVSWGVQCNNARADATKDMA